MTTLDGHAADPELVLAAGRALAPLGLRVDHAVGRGRSVARVPSAEPVAPGRGEGPVVALVVTPDGVRDGAGRPPAWAQRAAGERSRDAGSGRPRAGP